MDQACTNFHLDNVCWCCGLGCVPCRASITDGIPGSHSILELCLQPRSLSDQEHLRVQMVWHTAYVHHEWLLHSSRCLVLHSKRVNAVWCYTVAAVWCYTVDAVWCYTVAAVWCYTVDAVW